MITTNGTLVVITGITGQQGSSVANALIQSTQGYRLRGLTRNPSQPLAQNFARQGVEILQCDLSVGNETAIEQAFAEAQYIFGVTNYELHGDAAREIAEGKMMVDLAAKVSNLKAFLWSSLEPVDRISGGKFSHAVFFDTKAEVADYALRTGGPPTIIVTAGFFADNFGRPYGFRQISKDEYELALPCHPGVALPYLDVKHDYGLYVQAAIEGHFKPGDHLCSGSPISLELLVQQASQVTGKKIKYRQCSRAEFLNKLEFLGGLAVVLADMFGYFDKYGYYNGQPITPVDQLSRKSRSWIEFAEAVKEEQGAESLLAPTEIHF